MLCMQVASYTPLQAQVTDSTYGILDALKHTITDWEETDTAGMVYTTVNIKDLMAFEGKIIRNIKLQRLNFGEPIALNGPIDIQMLDNRMSLLDRFHKQTRETTLLKNIVFRPHTPFNPYLIADNERFLRSLPFIKDARIIPVPLTDPDSIDIIIVTADLFSIIPGTGGVSPKRQKFSIRDINVLGTGQTLGYTFLHDSRRSPSIGGDLYYGYNNIKGKFINLGIDGSKINRNLYDRREDEMAINATLTRPLVTQYSIWAGGLSLGGAKSLNRYNNLYGGDFYKYQHHYGQLWVGLNLGARKFRDDKNYHLKKFIAIGYFNDIFTEVPPQINTQEFDQRFNTQQGLLAKLTLFRQYYYKTNYIYGFGATEDVPRGFNLSFTAGWYKQLDLSRPYAGVDFSAYCISSKGYIYQYFARLGTFYNASSSHFQDNTMIIGASIFTRLINYRNYKIRQYLRISYSQLFNRTALDPLRINNVFGIRSLNSDSLVGNRRISLRNEYVAYMPQKIFGFYAAPLIFGDFAFLTSTNRIFGRSGFWCSLGAGIRVRNENLALNTIEFRAYYIPRHIAYENAIKFSVVANLQFRFNSSYVSAPNIISTNSDPNGDIY